MEILQYTLMKGEIDRLTEFQLSVWNVLSLLLTKLDAKKISPESTIEKGLGIDIFLRIKESDYVIYLSITEDRFYINSKYLDIYLYPETPREKIETFVNEFFQGKYLIRLSYDHNNKLVRKVIIFEDNELEEYNQDQKIGVFNRKYRYEKDLKGIELIRPNCLG